MLNGESTVIAILTIEVSDSFMDLKNKRPYSKSKLELNLKKSNLSDAIKLSSVLISFYFAFKVRI